MRQILFLVLIALAATAAKNTDGTAAKTAAD